MVISKIDRTKLRQAVEQFGSLQDAVQHLQKGKLVLEKKKVRLKEETEKLVLTREKLSHEIKEMNDEINSCNTDLQSLFDRIAKYSRQYALFCGFMAMVAGSPSIDNSLRNVIALFQRLIDTGWYMSKSALDMRSLFVHSIMGDYLKCFRCDNCGGKFIVNKDPHYKFFNNDYYCPTCHYSFGVRQDDSFLQAMVSEEQFEDIRKIGEVLKENEALKPLRVFLGMPCEICGKPVNEWDEQNIKLVISGMGCGHTQCWNSQLGQLRQIGKVIKKVKQCSNQG